MMLVVVMVCVCVRVYFFQPLTDEALHHHRQQVGICYGGRRTVAARRAGGRAVVEWRSTGGIAVHTISVVLGREELVTFYI